MTSLDTMLSALEPIGKDRKSGGYKRLAWTHEDHALGEWFVGEAGSRGLEVTVDRAGNQWAWWGDPDQASGGTGVVAGSHLDSVPDGGPFDGPLGVVSAFAAIDEIRRRGLVPARPIGVARFVDEEGARFGIACAGSRLLTGALSPERALGLRDADGVSMEEAMRNAGHDVAQLGADPPVLRRVGTFVELHIEQGRCLVSLGKPVGVASEIWPHGRWRLELAGEANHAGTTRLDDRDDPMLPFAQVVLAARRAAEVHGCVATVGKVLVQPNAVNAIASRVTAWLDARGPDEADVRAVAAEVAEAATTTAVGESFTAATAFDPRLRSRLAGALGDAPVLGTGAGHDAGIISSAGIETAMLWVRNPTGVSHSPAEHADRADCLAGVDALTTVLSELTGARPATAP
jgi:N-carbamoyl-L-amino-acid hydrolase